MSIQSAVNQTIGTLGVATKLFSMGKMNKANKSADDLKLAKIKQKANLEQQRAKLAKAKLQKTKATQQLKELKSATKNEQITIGGQSVNIKDLSPNLQKIIKEQSKDGRK